ncbi:DUF3006 domain-containing protein [Clostridium ganghwense]|uniref:DUF3006 domain-containing protein n=1 Tax=Clostridium ganghwense TaxID=312089 RepID=A0ABT4CUL7_9CLOT|nr:DUF3006 domain-containing protein [Clostridium ganghwense]MCY6372133.1 DUF3006 domain-containing protein [Clostridium ganghwense]
MLGVIDRFEEEFAVVELDDGGMINIERNLVPKEAEEGYVLNMTDKITIDYEETEKRKKEIEELTEGLWDE